MTATVTVTRDGHFYQHTLTRDGSTVMANGRIDAERAEQIVAANPDGRCIEGDLSFAAQPTRWTWQAEVTFAAV